MPSSNKKLFIITFIIAVIAIVFFVSFIGGGSRGQQSIIPGATGTLQEEEEPGGTPIDAYASTTLYFTTLNAFPDGKGEGAIGCGDGLVAYQIPVDETNGSYRGDLATYVLQRLQDPNYFANVKADFKKGSANKNPGTSFSVISGPQDSSKLELNNALVNSKISVQSLRDAQGAYEIKLKGQALLGGVCDEPRTAAQLKKSMQAVFGTTEVKVYLNGKLL